MMKVTLEVSLDKSRDLSMLQEWIEKGCELHIGDSGSYTELDITVKKITQEIDYRSEF